MRLDALRMMIRGTTRNEWNHIYCNGFGNGPSYRDRFESSLRDTPDVLETEIDSHTEVAVLKSDIDISLAWGMDLECEGIRGHRLYRTFDWAKNLTDDEVRLTLADVFYRGALVDRSVLALVETGRTYLPHARQHHTGIHQGLMVASGWEFDFARLVNDLAQGDGFDQAFAQSGFVIGDD